MGTVGDFFRRAWDWIKRNPAVVLAAGVGVVAVYYLFFRGSGSSSSTPQGVAVSFPSGGGTGGTTSPSSSPTSNPTTPAPPVLPYNPDWGMLNSISDQGLQSLWAQLLNLEDQINQATLSGNTALATTLQNSWQGVWTQIQNYKPSSSTTTPPGTTPPTTPPSTSTPPSLTAAQLTAFQSAYAGAVGNTTDPLQAFNQWMAALTASAPQAVAALTQQQWYSLFDTFNQAAAFNPNNPYKNPTNALDLLNNALANPSSISGANNLYFYNGNQVYEWINGQVKNVTNQFVSQPQMPSAQNANNSMQALAKGR